jgi:hypothetical protein
MSIECLTSVSTRGDALGGELTDPLITVIYPLFDLRGRTADVLRTWTEQQTLSRQHYRVCVLSSGEDRSNEHALPLGDSDQLIEVPKANDAAMWNAGAARATTPWLVFIEGHSLADPDCLEHVAQWASAGHGVVGNFIVRHSDAYLMARLADRWFGQIQSIWRGAGTWRRLHRSGFAIRADVFARAGGFASEYGQFAPALLSARLDTLGVRMDDISGAAVLHLDDAATRDHHYDTADYAIGEIACRSSEPQDFFERYFGHSDLWSNRLCCDKTMRRRMLRAIGLVTLSHPQHLPTLVTIAVLLLRDAIIGTPAWDWLQRALIRLDEFAIDHLPLTSKLQWSRFLRAHRRVVTQAQRNWTRQHLDPGMPQAAPVSFPVEAATPGDLGGIHALERFESRNFRWTWPMFVLRFDSNATAVEIHIDTNGVRGNPLDSVIAVVVGGAILPGSALSVRAGVLIIALSEELAGAARDGILVICKAFVPKRTGSSDRRRLGLPIFTIDSKRVE